MRWNLLYPVGSIADRAEYLFTGELAPDLATFAPLSEQDSDRNDWTVADIRGTRLSPEGQYFHVYRPDSGATQASMTGWEWLRNVPHAQQRATELLASHAATHNAPLADEPMPETAIAQLRRLNNCSACHVPDKPSIRSAKEEDLIERATDSLGFVTPLATLTDGVVVAHHRPEDVNGEDPFVSVRCENGVAARLETRGDYEHFKCDDGTPPRGFRDFRAGMAQSHPYTVAVCESRRKLHQRMTDRARRLFARSVEVCDIK